MCSLPTFCGLCLTDRPHTSALQNQDIYTETDPETNQYNWDQKNVQFLVRYNWGAYTSVYPSRNLRLVSRKLGIVSRKLGIATVILNKTSEVYKWKHATEVGIACEAIYQQSRPSGDSMMTLTKLPVSTTAHAC